MVEAFTLGGEEMNQERLLTLLKKEDEEGFADCSNRLLECFFDGLIVQKRGVRTDGGDFQAPTVYGKERTNNTILRKIRIALELKDEEMLVVMQSVGVKVSKSELGALFRSKGHKNYKECGDQFLRSFLNGLTARCRKLPADNQ